MIKSDWTNKMFEEWLNLYFFSTHENREMAFLLVSKLFKIHTMQEESLWVLKNDEWVKRENRGWKNGIGDWEFWHYLYNSFNGNDSKFFKYHREVDSLELIGYEKAWMISTYETQNCQYIKRFALTSYEDNKGADGSKFHTPNWVHPETIVNTYRLIIALRHRNNPRSVKRQLFGRPVNKNPLQLKQT